MRPREPRRVSASPWPLRPCGLSLALFVLAGSATAQSSPTTDARAALRAGDLARAHEQASAAVLAAPDDPDAWSVLGMVQAERGEPTRALSSFDAAIARSGATPSAPLLWNRAVCLSKLGRHEQAEQAFLQASERAEPPLDALSMLNAGFAAIDADARQRAREHMQRAEALDREHALEAELAELRVELEALAAPADAVPAARDSPAQEHDALERTYLDLLAGGLWLTGRGVRADLGLALGYDSNAARAGLSENDLQLADEPALGSPYARLDAEVSYGFEPKERSFVAARYGFEQLAYAQGVLDLYNAQVHALSLEGEQRIGKRYFTGALVRGRFELSGLEKLRTFMLGAGLELWAGLTDGAALRMQLAAGLEQDEALDSAFEFLSGTRLDLTLRVLSGHGALHVGASIAYRVELLGKDRQATDPPLELCADACNELTAAYVIPVGYHGPRAALFLSYRLLDPLHAFARLAGELRAYRSQSFLQLVDSRGDARDFARRAERAKRLYVSSGFTFELSAALELELVYDLTLAGSNIDDTLGGRHALDYGNRNFVRHDISLGIAGHFE